MNGNYIFEPSENPRVRVHFLLCHFLQKKQKSKPFDLDFLAGAEGKRGDKQLITVFCDAPDENKEPEEAKTCEADEWRLYFRAVGEPEG
jgi:hypothetical protein